MFNEQLFNIKAKVLGLMAISTILVGIIGMLSVHGISNRMSEYTDMINSDVQGAYISTQMNLEFKRQVQEWKNILLRGHNTADLDKYWGKFQDRHSSVQRLAVEFQELDLSSELKRDMKEFAHFHSQLLDSYKVGRDTFISTEYDHMAADASVRGIDRAPSQALEVLSNSILSQSAKQANELEGRSESTKSTAYLAMLACLALAILISTVFINLDIVKPLRLLIQQARSVSRGDYDQKVQLFRSDEIGTLSKAIEVSRQQLLSFREEMTTTINQLGHVCENVQVSASEIAKGVNDQDTRVEGVATAMSEMSLTASSVSENAEQAASAANSADEATQEGNTNMGFVVSAIKDSSQQVVSTTDVINKLNDDASNISTVLDVIKNIAEQTNLLALNAAIEAARAGEQGRGFAVVADEVRTLAQKTQHSTTEIQEIIDRILAGTENAVKEITQVQKYSDVSVEKVEAVDSSLHMIVRSIERIQGMNQQIATAASEQADVASEIAESLHLIKDISATNAQHAEDCTRVNATLLSTKERLDCTIGKLSAS